jgi:hypothetical protein
MDTMRRTYLLAVAAVGLACGGHGSLPDAIINNSADDPCDPGSGATQNGSAPAVDAGAKPVALPGGSAGIGFDDMRFSGNLAQLLVPAGRTGDLDFVDPSTENVATIGGFSSSPTYASNSSFGVTSADEGNAIVYATDRTAGTLTVVDGQQRKVEATAMLASTPGYVRYVGPTHEVWVTEPAANQIEVFTVPSDETTPPPHSMFIMVGGAESLEVDATNGLAFTNSNTMTFSIDVMKHSVSAMWPNGCTTARGLAIDPNRGWVMVGCEEGKAVVLGETSGSMLGTVTTGAGVDRVAYDPTTTRLYVPSATAGSMTVAAIAGTGVPGKLGSIDVAVGAHCVVTPGAGELFVCDPTKGELDLLGDPF